MIAEVLERPAVDSANPFPGLRPFEADESDLFFGREDDIFDLLDRLRHMRFLAVVGSSGCGKSSLIRAGLIAALRDGALTEDGGVWHIAVLRPWQSPIAQLAAALGGPAALDVPADSPEESAAVLKPILLRGSLGVVEALKRYPLGPGHKLLILVDQFEELFTFMDESAVRGAQDEARAFVKLLLEPLAAERGANSVYVALTMRSDFLGNCASLQGLADAINNGLYLLPQMSRDQLRDAIKGPVEACRAQISDRLVDTLINDLGDDDDQLPVLQHALMRLWAEWVRGGGAPRGAPIGFEHYRQIGELTGSLHKHAEEVFGALPPHRRQTAEALFRAITKVTDEGRVVRRQTPLGRVRQFAGLSDEGDGELAAVVEEFRRDGRSFLVPPPKVALSDETVVDISHESLIRRWKRLRGWAEDEALRRELQRQIGEAARIWVANGRDDSFLFRGNRLLQADAWSKDNPNALDEAESEFLVASQDAYERELLERPRRGLTSRLAEEAVSQVASIEKDAAHIFLAHARADRAFVERLRAAFREADHETLVDWDILPTEDFEVHMRAAIEAADTFVYVISPDAAASPLCQRELEHAISQHKRIVPILLRPVADGSLPKQLRAVQWISFTGKDNFEVAFAALRGAINTDDLFWVQAHSRLLVRATEWNKRGREWGMLLRGRSLSAAERWLGKQGLDPDLTPLQREYIIASRASANRRHRWIIMVIVAAALVLSYAAYSAYDAQQKSEEVLRSEREKNEAERRRVEAEKEVAEIQRVSAERDVDYARMQREAAETARELADRQRQAAERARAAERRARQQLQKQNAELKGVAQASKEVIDQVRAPDSKLVQSQKLDNLARRLIKLGFYDTSIGVYELLLAMPALDAKEAAHHIELWENLAQAYQRKGRAADAQRARGEAAKLRAVLGKELARPGRP